MWPAQGLDEDALAEMAEFVQPVPLTAATASLQSGVLTTSLPRLTASQRRPQRVPVSATRRRPAAAARTETQPAQVAAAPAGDILAKVAGIVATVLGAEVSHEQPLMAAGLDSLGAVELRNALAAAFGTELPPTVTLDYPTIAALAAYISGSAAGNASAVPDATAADSGKDEDLHVEV